MSEEEGQGAAEPTVEVVKKNEDGLVAGLVADVVEVKEVGDSAGASASDALASMKDRFATLKCWGNTAGNITSESLFAVGAWNQTETPLRGCIKEVRLGLNCAVAKVRGENTIYQQKFRAAMEEEMKMRKVQSAKINQSGILTKCSELRRQHPELVIGGVTLAVALPSALAGKRAFFRNGAVALTLSAGMLHGSDWFKRRMMKRMREKEADDSGPPRS